METLRRTWALNRAAWQVIRLDSELLIFPILSGISLLFVGGGFISSFVLLTFMGGDNLPEWVGYLFAFPLYFVAYLVIFYFQAALISAALIRLKGGDPDVRVGLRMASRRMGVIMKWALLAATVGVLLSWLKDKGGWLMHWVASFADLAWNVVTYLVIPVLVVEGKDPRDALDRSRELVRNTWGEQVGTVVSQSLLGFLGSVAILVVLVALGMLGMPVLWLLVGGWCLFVSWAVLVSTLGTVVRAVVYLYARDGEVPEVFDRNLVRDALR